MQGSATGTTGQQGQQQTQQKPNQTGQAGSTTNVQNNSGAQPTNQSQVGQSQNNIPNQSTTNQNAGQKPADEQVKKVQTKFQSVSLREYYDSSNLTLVITKGLEELGRQRPANPIRFLGNFLLDHDPEK